MGLFLFEHFLWHRMQKSDGIFCLSFILKELVRGNQKQMEQTRVWWTQRYQNKKPLWWQAWKPRNIIKNKTVTVHTKKLIFLQRQIFQTRRPEEAAKKKASHQEAYLMTIRHVIIREENNPDLDELWAWIIMMKTTKHRTTTSILIAQGLRSLTL